LGNKKRVLYLGRLDPKKGINRLISAWSLLEEDFPEWVLQISGTGSQRYRKVLQMQAKNLKLSNVIFTDGIFGEECNDLIENSDIFVLPTLSESWPLSVGQALMLQVPVITTKGAPFPELESQKCGFWIDHGAFPLFLALHKMMTYSNQERRNFGKNGRKWVKRELSWSKIAGRYLVQYRLLQSV
jgi:glycosyltransferase involved in cell wall biosynthesis